MRESLADNLNLTGTARYNLTIRHKLELTRMGRRANVPAAWESVVPFFNHSELAHVNQLAQKAGCCQLPFQKVEKLVEDTGERFFSEYLRWMRAVKPKHDIRDMCCCVRCSPGSKPPVVVNQLVPAATPVISPSMKPAPSFVTPPPTVAPTAALFVPPTPFFFHPYAMMAQQQQQQVYGFCCLRYREYCFRQDKRGRPPHDNRCRFKKRGASLE